VKRFPFFGLEGMDMGQLSLGDFYEKCKHPLDLQLIAGGWGLNKKIQKAVVERPGLCLAGHFSHFPEGSLLVLGKRELSYIENLKFSILSKRLEQIAPLGIVLAESCLFRKKICSFCEKKEVAVFLSSKSCDEIIGRAFSFFEEFLAPAITLPGTLVEVFGMGVLLQGESSVGKSFSSLCLLDRGHRLISDDVVFIKKRNWKDLIGFSSELSRHLMEIRGIGLVHTAHLFGASAVKMEQTIDLVLRLETGKLEEQKDPLGLKENFVNILGLPLPLYTLNIASSNVALLIESIVRNHRLKQMGIHTAKKFSVKLLKKIKQKKVIL
jgi:HPr kinase/phosphorylase